MPGVENAQQIGAARGLKEVVGLVTHERHTVGVDDAEEGGGADRARKHWLGDEI